MRTKADLIVSLVGYLLFAAMAIAVVSAVLVS